MTKGTTAEISLSHLSTETVDQIRFQRDRSQLVIYQTQECHSNFQQFGILIKIPDRNAFDPTLHITYGDLARLVYWAQTMQFDWLHLVSNGPVFKDIYAYKPGERAPRCVDFPNMERAAARLSDPDRDSIAGRSLRNMNQSQIAQIVHRRLLLASADELDKYCACVDKYARE